MQTDRRWAAAMAEHEAAVRAFIAACERIAPADWQGSPAPDKWSPAAVALHVCITYELGRDAPAGGKSMRLRVHPAFAWLLRTTLMPMMFATRRFPRGAPAPSEVTPNLAQSRRLERDAAVIRLKRVAAEAALALRKAGRDRSPRRFTHVVFGPLSPYSSLRLFSAHTMHHVRGLNAAAGAGKIAREAAH